MRRSSIRSRWIKGALVVLVGVVALGAKPVVDTWEDLEHVDSAIRGDFETVKRAGAFAQKDSAASWLDCKRPFLADGHTIQGLRTQVGVVVLNAAVSAAIADGCNVEVASMDVPTMTQAFDARPHAWRWPLVAAAIHAWRGHSEEEIAAGLRAQLLQQRAVAECVGSSARTLRAATTDRPYTELAQIHDACQRSAGELDVARRGA